MQNNAPQGGEPEEKKYPSIPDDKEILSEDQAEEEGGLENDESREDDDLQDETFEDEENLKDDEVQDVSLENEESLDGNEVQDMSLEDVEEEEDPGKEQTLMMK